MIYPEKIKVGDMIGVTALSEGANLDTIDNAIANFNRLGFSTLETSNVRNNEWLVSSDAKTRVEQFMELWKNKNIKYIIAARGGEFLMETLPYFEEYKKVIPKYFPKWVQGFSDTSLLLYYLTTNYNIATVHAENIGDYAMKNLDESLTNTVSLLKSDKEFTQESFKMYQEGYVEQEEFNSYVLTKKVEYKSLYRRAEETVSGRMLGGCIDALRLLLGTKYDNTIKYCKQFKEGILWYFDNCELSLFDLYRTLWQFKEAGWFENAKGFLIGRSMVDNIVKTKYGDVTEEDMLKRVFDDVNVPVIYDVDIGHVSPQMTIINGSYGDFYYTNGQGRLIQKLREK